MIHKGPYDASKILIYRKGTFEAGDTVPPANVELPMGSLTAPFSGDETLHEFVTCRPTPLCAQCGLRPGPLRHTLPATNVCDLCWGMHECFYCGEDPTHFIDTPPFGTIYFCNSCFDEDAIEALLELLFIHPPEIGEYEEEDEDEEEYP